MPDVDNTLLFKKLISLKFKVHLLNKRCVWREIISYTVKVKHLYSFYFQVYDFESLGFSLQVMSSNECFAFGKIQDAKLIVFKVLIRNCTASLIFFCSFIRNWAA